MGASHRATRAARHTSICAALLPIAAALHAPRALAGEAAVAGIAPGDDTRLVSGAVHRILDEKGSAALSDATVAVRLGKALRPAPVVAPGFEEELARERDDVLGAVAFGYDDEAIARGTPVLERERPRLAVTNRSDAAARSLADICLFLVRAELHRGNSPAATSRAAECLRLVPDLAPSGALHPPDVVAALDEARRSSTALLRVEARSAGGTPCTARVEGRRPSSLPAEFQVLPGTYSVQVECSESGSKSGWIRDIAAKPGTTSRVEVEPRLEAGLALEPSLAIGREHPPRDLSMLFEWLAIEDLWTVERRDSAFVVTRYSLRGAEVVSRGTRAVPRVEGAKLPPGLERAVIELSCLDAPCGAPQPSSDARRTIGTIGGGIGAAAMVASWILYVRFGEVDDELAPLRLDDPRHEALWNEYSRLRTATLVTTISGSGLFAAMAPLWLPERERVPWWAWSSAAAGVATVGVGTAIGLGTDSREPANCPPNVEDCFRYAPTALLPPLLISQGLALLSVPATYAIRQLLGAKTGSLELGGSFGQLHATWKHTLPF